MMYIKAVHTERALFIVLFSLYSLISFAQKEIKVELNENIFHEHYYTIYEPILKITSDTVTYRHKKTKIRLPKLSLKLDKSIAFIRHSLRRDLINKFPFMALLIGLDSNKPHLIVDFNQNNNFCDDEVLTLVKRNQWRFVIEESNYRDVEAELTVDTIDNLKRGSYIFCGYRRNVLREIKYYLSITYNLKYPVYSQGLKRIIDKKMLFRVSLIDSAAGKPKFSGEIYKGLKPPNYYPVTLFTIYHDDHGTLKPFDNDTTFTKLENDTFKINNKSFKIREVDKYGKWLKIEYLPDTLTKHFKVAETVPNLKIEEINFENTTLNDLVKENEYSLLSIWNSKDYYGMFYSLSKADSTDFRSLNTNIIGLHHGEMDGYDKAMKVYKFRWNNYICPEELYDKIDPINYPSYTLIDRNRKIILLDETLDRILHLLKTEKERK